MNWPFTKQASDCFLGNYAHGYGDLIAPPGWSCEEPLQIKPVISMERVLTLIVRQTNKQPQNTSEKFNFESANTV